MWRGTSQLLEDSTNGRGKQGAFRRIAWDLILCCLFGRYRVQAYCLWMFIRTPYTTPNTCQVSAVISPLAPLLTTVTHGVSHYSLSL